MYWFCFWVVPMGFFSFFFTHCVLSEGSGPAIWCMWFLFIYIYTYSDWNKCIYIYIYIYIFRYTYVNLHIDRFTYTCIYIYIHIHVFKCTYWFRGNGIHGVHEIYDQGMCWSWFVAIATMKEFMFVLGWWLAICNLKYTWGCEGLWKPQYPPNQPRVIHDWFPFQQKD